MFKNLSAVVFMMVAGCASETAVNDQITDSVTQTPAPVTETPTNASNTAAEITVTVVPSATSCVDGSTPVNGVCPQSNAPTVQPVVDSTTTTVK